MEKLKENFSNNLINLRKEKKLTQLELAQMLNYSDKSISKWENGDTVPDIFVIKKIADFFNVSIDAILDEPKNIEHKIELKKEKNKIVITLLSTLVVWIVATVLYSLFHILLNVNFWLCFVWAVPASFVILIIFNAIWAKKKFSVLLTSGLMWSTITAIYLQLLFLNFWQIFIIALPLQLGIVLWNNLNIKK